LQFFNNDAITAVRLKRTSILPQIKIRQREKRKKTAIHKIFTYSMRNSGRIAATIIKIEKR
jgi:hypothetical protein